MKATLNNTVEKFEGNLSREQDNYKERISKELKQQLEVERQIHEATLEKERRKHERLVQERDKVLASERKKAEEKIKLCDQLQLSNSKLEAKGIASVAKIESLKAAHSTLEEKMGAMEAAMSTKEHETETRRRALLEKDTTISEMSELLTKTRQYLKTKPQVSAYRFTIISHVHV